MSSLLLPLAQIGNDEIAVDGDPFAGLMANLAIVAVVAVVLTIFYVYCYWVIFEKAGKPGWASIIPIYNGVVFFEIAGRPGWWIILTFIPFVNIVVVLIALVDFCRNFGKGIGYVLGLIFLGFLFIPLLAFGDAKYQPQSAS